MQTMKFINRPLSSEVHKLV